MSYTNLVLADRPLGYWSGPSISRKNLLTDNQYSIETSTIGWSALDNTSISRVTTDSWDGSASLKISATSTSECGIKISAGSRIQLAYGITYTMVARVKNISGNRNARIRIEYITTQNGSTLSEPVRLGEEFSVSSSEWTTIYHTETLPTGISTNYFSSWGIISGSGQATDEIIVDGIQFFQGPLYSIYDERYENDASLRYFNYQKSKPIIFGGDESIRLNKEAIVEIPNNYKLFIQGTEDKAGCLDFWFTLERPPSYRHQLLKIGPFISAYIENDKVYIDYLGSRNFIQVNDWSRQHYVNIVYSEKNISMHIDDNLSTSISLGNDFLFSRVIESITPTIVVGPCSTSYNILPNPSFNQNLDGWDSQNSSISIITSDSFSGTGCAEITKQAVSNSGVVLSNYVSVLPYNTYTLSAYVKIPSGSSNSTLQLVCEEYDSYSSDNLINTTTQNISLSDNDWHRVNLHFTPSIDTVSVLIKLIQPNAGTAGQKFLCDAFMLEKNDSLTVWSENSQDSDPLFISSIGLYSYDIGEEKRIERFRYGSIDDQDNLAVEYQADRIPLNYSKSLAESEFNVLSEENVINATMDNFSYSETGISMIPLFTESVSVGTDGGSATLNSRGIKFSDSAFINLTQANSYFNPLSSTIRLQTLFDDTSGDGTLLVVGGVLNSYGIAVQKVSNKIIISNIVDPLISPEIICQTQTITSGLVNLALNFENQKLSVKVGSEEFTDLDIPFISPGGSISLGNIPENSEAYPDYIRNFAIDNLTDFNNIDYISTGRYMLRFNGSLNVSQRAEFSFTTPTPDPGSNSVVSFNTASQNNVYINGIKLNDISYIPNFNYYSPEPVQVLITAETENSSTDRKTVNNLYVSSYDSDNLISSLSNFTLMHNSLYADVYEDTYVDIYGGNFKEPFIMNVIESNVLSHSDNLGIRFDKSISSGCKIVANGSAEYEMLELVFKINLQNNRLESYTIFDVVGPTNINLKYSNNQLIKNGTYDIYLDGELISNISDIEIFPGEFYHLVVAFSESLSSEIHIGINKTMDEKLDGTIGKINVYQVAPSNIATFCSDKYQDLVGKMFRSIDGGSASISDTSLTQQYVRDTFNEYYEMKNLPKVRIVSES